LKSGEVDLNESMVDDILGVYKTYMVRMNIPG